MLYTIGTSNRSFEDFVRPLRSYGVTTAFDVRSRPYSRFRHFNRDRLEAALADRRIAYRWLGETLGGEATVHINSHEARRTLTELVDMCRTANGVIFCAEHDPASCHRTWAIGKALLGQFDVSVLNILKNDELEPIDHTLQRMGVRVNRA